MLHKTLRKLNYISHITIFKSYSFLFFKFKLKILQFEGEPKINKMKRNFMLIKQYTLTWKNKQTEETFELS